jgi:phosphoribosylaminoimidazole-succinocarboxamide synthase
MAKGSDKGKSGRSKSASSQNKEARGKLLQVGKVKEVYATEDPGVLEFVFTDKISVFDKVIPSIIPDKGETLCRGSAFWFEKAKGIGIGSHFLKLTAGNRMRVKKVNIIRDYAKINTKTTNYLIPLESICRYFLAGSLDDRVKKGKIKPEDLGFRSGYAPKYGERLPEPHFEVTTKLESVDRKITVEEALKIAGLTKDEFEDLRNAVLKVDKLIEKEVEKRGLLHADGKKEFAFDKDRKLMLIDTFGTADEDRFWDKKIYEEKGECVELSKEFVRKYYRGIGYVDKLEAARAACQEEPPIPGLESGFIKQVSAVYIDLFERITGQKFR